VGKIRSGKGNEIKLYFLSGHIILQLINNHYKKLLHIHSSFLVIAHEKNNYSYSFTYGNMPAFFNPPIAADSSVCSPDGFKPI
jgi:hypothetical protein